jgi:hypothetical protein
MGFGQWGQERDVNSLCFVCLIFFRPLRLITFRRILLAYYHPQPRSPRSDISDYNTRFRISTRRPFESSARPSVQYRPTRYQRRRSSFAYELVQRAFGVHRGGSAFVLVECAVDGEADRD